MKDLWEISSSQAKENPGNLVGPILIKSSPKLIFVYKIKYKRIFLTKYEFLALKREVLLMAWSILNIILKYGF